MKNTFGTLLLVILSCTAFGSQRQTGDSPKPSREELVRDCDCDGKSPSQRAKISELQEDSGYIYRGFRTLNGNTRKFAHWNKSLHGFYKSAEDIKAFLEQERLFGHRDMPPTPKNIATFQEKLNTKRSNMASTSPIVSGFDAFISENILIILALKQRGTDVIAAINRDLAGLGCCHPYASQKL